jgi:hypothetical protein
VHPQSRPNNTGTRPEESHKIEIPRSFFQRRNFGQDNFRKSLEASATQPLYRAAEDKHLWRRTGSENEKAHAEQTTTKVKRRLAAKDVGETCVDWLEGDDREQVGSAHPESFEA